MKGHQTWQVPERRLNKFIKRQKQGEPMTFDDDTTLSSKKPGHRIKGFFKALGGTSTAKKPEAKNPEAAPPKKPVEEVVAKEEPPVVAEPEPAVEEEAAVGPGTDARMPSPDRNAGRRGRL